MIVRKQLMTIGAKPITLHWAYTTAKDTIKYLAKKKKKKCKA